MGNAQEAVDESLEDDPDALFTRSTCRGNSLQRRRNMAVFLDFKRSVRRTGWRSSSMTTVHSSQGISDGALMSF